MHPFDRKLTPILTTVAALALAVAACGGSSSGAASPSPVGPSLTAPPMVTPSAAPTASATPPATPLPTPVASPSPAEACAIELESGPIVSDRLVDVTIEGTDDADIVTFVFGNPSPERPQGPADGRLQAATPPYTQAASGLPVKLNGEHVAEVMFTGMSIMNDIGEPTYDGALEFRPGLPALKDVVNFDMFEGHVGWYLAYDGLGCVRLATDGQDITVTFEHG
jgi:hypothetical protein